VPEARESRETAFKNLRKWINLLEKNSRANVCCVAVLEAKSKAGGHRVPRHFHLFVASYALISREKMEVLWPRLVWGSRAENVRVEAFDPKKNGIQYSFKFLTDPETDWIPHRLELFPPGVRGTTNPSHRSERHRRRSKLQAADSLVGDRSGDILSLRSRKTREVA
jgi:hypothetical protein